MNFISGDNFKELSDIIFDNHGYTIKNSTNNIPTCFVKTDFIHDFFSNNLFPKTKFKLITHNSDYDIDFSYKKYLEHENLIKWYAQNINYIHQKLIPIPIGIANPMWPHGDIKILKSVIDNNYDKKQLMYANFNVNTNPRQRNYCLQYIKPEFIENNVSFTTYLQNMARSYFSICPLGNGIDSHRIWESLYLKTIPICETTYNIEYLKRKFKLPILTISDWSDVNQMVINSTLYHSIWNNFDISRLSIPSILQDII